MSNEKHTSGPEKDIHSQRPRFLDPDAREKAELGYFLNEEEEPVEVELIGAPTEFMDEDYGIPRPIDLDDPPKPCLLYTSRHTPTTNTYKEKHNTGPCQQYWRGLVLS